MEDTESAEIEGVEIEFTASGQIGNRDQGVFASEGPEMRFSMSSLISEILET